MEILHNLIYYPLFMVWRLRKTPLWFKEACLFVREVLFELLLQ